MPIYEYKCKKCGQEFEIEQRITADPLTECPDESCKGEIFRKISKNVGLMFKGSGFYLTDYANKKNSTAPVHKNGNSTSEKKPAENPTESKSKSTEKNTA